MFWKKRKGQQISPTAKQEDNRIAEAISALKYTISDNAQADRNQERREDIGNKVIQLLTLVFVILTTVGIFYQDHILNKTDAAAHESATAAKEAANAAKISAEATTKNVDALIKSERAQLFIGTLALNKNGDNDPHPQINYTWVNLGRGAAVISEVEIGCQLVGSKIPIIPADDEHKIRRGQAAIGPSAIGGVGAAPNPLSPCTLDKELSATDWTDIAAKQKFILFDGYIRYRDAFHKYKWRFGSIYIGDAKFFSTVSVPPAYNEETIEDGN
jgi:hypothetical protein